MFDIKGILDPIVAIINKVVPDKTAAAAAQAQMQALVMQGQLSEELTQLQAVTTNQSDINKVEASSALTFVAGWRPFIGWVCGVAFGFQFLAKPAIEWGATLVGHPVTLPGLDATLPQLTYALLGLGAYRTAEKFKGVVGAH